ncbi:MAG TPA: hypothetical protein DHW25_06430 [Blautia sp.]|nr:hypothetical protein [Blautia sp.]
MNRHVQYFLQTVIIILRIHENTIVFLLKTQFYGKNGKKNKDVIKTTQFWGQQWYSYSRL